MSNSNAPFRPSALRGFFVLVVLVTSNTYAAMYRHWTDWLLYSYVAAIPLALVIILRETRMYREAAPSSRDKAVVIAKHLILVPIVAILLTPMGGLFYSIAATITDLIQWLALQLSENGRSAALAGAVTALLGAGFFAFRLKFRFIYGMTEAMVGLGVAGHRVGFATTSEPGGSAALYLAVLTAGVYLVVRGLDNAHQAWTLKSDPALNWLLEKRPK
jgi:hypothetical protein